MTNLGIGLIGLRLHGCRPLAGLAETRPRFLRPAAETPR